MGGFASSRCLVGLGAAVLCLRRVACDSGSSSDLPQRDHQLGAQCWKDGFTVDICCRKDPVVNCWDAEFTFSRCCSSSAWSGPRQESGASTAPTTATTTTTTTTSATTTTPAVSSSAVAGDASCWSGGYTFDRCCKVPPAVAAVDGCWDRVFTEVRCCQRTSVSSPPPSSSSSLSASSSSPSSPDPGPGGLNTALPAVSAAPDALAEGDMKTKGPGVSICTFPDCQGDQAGSVAIEDQAEFFRREGARRWPRYFQRAHQLLDIVLASTSESRRGSSWPPQQPDAVQVYHRIYEVVNQVIGGVQLASDSTKGSESQESILAEGRAIDAGLRAAFMSAATVLARLAKVSEGTPFQHEEFASQASAAIALSCRRSDEATFSRDLEQRMEWLQSGRSGGKVPGSHHTAWRSSLLELLNKHAETTAPRERVAAFERSWLMYAQDLTEALWRPAAGHAAEDELRHTDRSTFNPLDERAAQSPESTGRMWQLFSTYVMAKPLQNIFSRSSTAKAAGCPPCAELSRIVLQKYAEFERALLNESSAETEADAGTAAGPSRRDLRPDEVNNAFFAWQLTHESEQAGERGEEVWPELYRNSEDFVELRNVAKLACLEYLQQVYDAPLSALDLAQLELSIWASVTLPSSPSEPEHLEQPNPPTMGLAFHDHPLALLSGVFYAQAGGEGVTERTPTVFADPRGTTAFRYTVPEPVREQSQPRAARRGQRHSWTRTGQRHSRVSQSKAQARQRSEETLEPTAPFHRLAYAHAYEGLALVFPSWLVHGVPAHTGSSARVTFAFNLHTLQGTTLSSWAKTTL